MKYLLLLLIVSLNAFAVSGVPNNYNVGKTLKVASEYITGMSKVDGSFETDTAGWTASSGSITRTASNTMQGAYLGRWSTSGGAGTLDKTWTVTATNTYDLNFQFSSPVADADSYACAVVAGVETGCKLIDGPDYAVNTVRKISVVASATTGQTLLLRIKHTGADTEIMDVDDAKMEPWTPNYVNTVTQESVTYTGYTSKDGSNRVKFKTLDTARTSTSTLLASDNTTYTKFTILQVCNADVSANSDGSASAGFYLDHYDSSGTILKRSLGATSAGGYIAVTHSTKANVGDYFIVTHTGTPADSTGMNFSITCSAVAQNLVQSWADGSEWKTLTYTEVNALTGNQGLGTFTAGGVEWMRGKDGLLHYKGKLTLGTVTASEARIPYPAGLIAADTTKIPSIQLAGLMVYSAQASSTNSILVSPSLGYFNIGQTSTVLTPMNGSSLFSTGNVISFNFTVPIQGWSSMPSTILLPVSKTNEFSARINSDGTIASVNADWLNSSVRNSTGYYTINYAKLGLTVTPSIVVTGENGSGMSIGTFTGASNTSASFYLTNTSPVVADRNFHVHIQKQSPDYTPQGVMPVNITPDTFVQTAGVINPVHFSVSYGTTNATTVCSASPCSYLDQIGNYVTSVTRSGTGVYSLNTTKTYSKLKCTMTSQNVANSNNNQANNITPCAGSCNAIVFRTTSLGNVADDSNGTLMCDAIP